jgi:hypothetical protein
LLFINLQDGFNPAFHIWQEARKLEPGAHIIVKTGNSNPRKIGTYPWWKLGHTFDFVHEGADNGRKWDAALVELGFV